MDDLQRINSQNPSSSQEANVEEHCNAAQSRGLFAGDGLVALPEFWKNYPKLWFRQVEAIFAIHGIQCDNEKYNYVVCAQYPETIIHVADVIKRPPEREKYDALKNVLIERLTDLREQQIRQRLMEFRLSDKIPSQLLGEMQKLAGEGISDVFLRTFFIMCMPDAIRAFLFNSPDLSLNQLADTADRVLEICDSVRTASTGAQKMSDITDHYQSVKLRLNGLAKSVETLTAAFSKLCAKLYAFMDCCDENGRNSSRKRRGRSRTRSKSASSHVGVCYYHATFGDKARRCLRPCGYTTRTF